MGIDDISAKASGLWLRAKSALTGKLSDAPASPTPPPRAAGDSADLSHKGQYFAGYVFPAPGDAAAPGSGAIPAGNPPDGALPGDAKVWAPLVISPFEDPGEN
jgi:hypothetical protein